MAFIPGLTARYRSTRKHAQRMTLCGTLCCMLAGQAAFAAGSTPSDRHFDHDHYLIPGFSAHLIDTDMLVYQDLLAARRAARRRDTLRLRIALADANGHLLQMATPPALASLRDHIVSVSDGLRRAAAGHAALPWAPLIQSIRRLPMPNADRSARKRLLSTAGRGQALAEAGRFKAARLRIHRLISEIEITAHVFPIVRLRREVRSAVDAASHGGPHWQGASQAIKRAIHDTQWLIHPAGRDMIRAYDAAVAAYAEWPRQYDARRSLGQASWYLQHVSAMRRLADRFRKVADEHPLSLSDIAHLQHQLALGIHRSRDALSQHVGTASAG